MTQDNWIKAFDDIFMEANSYAAREHYKQCLEKASKLIQSQISQVEKDAIEKTNKRWGERCKNNKRDWKKQKAENGLMWNDGYNQALSDLLEDKKL